MTCKSVTEIVLNLHVDNPLKYVDNISKFKKLLEFETTLTSFKFQLTISETEIVYKLPEYVDKLNKFKNILEFSLV